METVSTIKGNRQYNQRKLSVQSKETVSTIEGEHQLNRRRASVESKESTSTFEAIGLLFPNARIQAKDEVFMESVLAWK